MESVTQIIPLEPKLVRFFDVLGNRLTKRIQQKVKHCTICNRSHRAWNREVKGLIVV